MRTRFVGPSTAAVGVASALIHSGFNGAKMAGGPAEGLVRVLGWFVSYERAKTIRNG